MFEEVRGPAAGAAAAVVRLDRANALVNCAQLTLLRSIVECDLRRVYLEDDCDNVAHWLSMRLGISSWKARRLVAAAYALDELPRCVESLERGEISLDKFVELARYVTRATEPEELAWARSRSVAAVRDRADRSLRVPDELVREADRTRSLSWWWEGDSRLSLYGSLPADQGLLVTKALDRLAEQMPTTTLDDSDDPLAGIEARRADALVTMATGSLSEDTDAEQATVVIHADLGALQDHTANAVAENGRPVPPQIARLFSCDGRVQPVVHDDNGTIVHVGSPSRTVPHWLRRQVAYRDDFRCTFPACGRKTFLDCHHVVPWELGGPTALHNLTMLCSTHHKAIHVHGWRVEITVAGRARWYRPDRTVYEAASGVPPEPGLGPEPEPPPDPASMWHGAPRSGARQGTIPFGRELSAVI